MKKTTPNKPNKLDTSGLRYVDEYKEFIVWIATPKELREPKTQSGLAKKFGVGEDTLSEWKRRNSFYDEVSKKRKEWGRDRTPDVIHALYSNILKTGSVSGVKLWLQYFEGWVEKVDTNLLKKDPLRELSDKELMEEIRKAQNFLRKKG